MKLSGAAGFAAGAAFALALAGGTAYAATGGTFILGRANSASTLTGLTSSAGSPLSLGAKAGYAPLRVSNKVKVPSLNSDLLDGLDSTAFARTTGKTGRIAATSKAVDFDGNGVLDALSALAKCPAGTLMTGGGSENFSSGPTLVDAPDAGGWQVLTPYDASVDTVDMVVAYVVCYNPRGAVPGATTLAARSTTSPGSGSWKTAVARSLSKK